MTLTKVCRNCRKPQLVENLVEFLEGKTKKVKRFRCKTPCQPHWIKPDSQPQDLGQISDVNPGNDKTYQDVLEGFLDGKIESFDVSLKDGEIKNIEEAQIEISYNGTVLEVETDRPQFITTVILGQRLNLELLAAIKTWLEHQWGHLHIFFKKRYVSDKDFFGATIAQLEAELDGFDYTLHLDRDLLINNQLEVLASANVHHTAVSPLSQVKARANAKYLIIPHARQEIEVTVNDSWVSKSLLASAGTLSILDKGHTQALGKVSFHSIAGGIVYRPEKDYGYGLIPINFDGNGFYEYAQYFDRDRVRTGYADTIYLSDLHSSMIDRNYLEVMKRDIKALCPLQVIAGDVMDNQSLCHHDMNRIGYNQSRMSFTRELAITKEVIKDLHSACESADFVSLWSNHEAFIYKYFSVPSNFKTLGKEDSVLAYRTLAYIIENTHHVEGGVKYANPMKYLYEDLLSDGWLKFEAKERFNIHLNSHGNEYSMGRNLGNQSNVKAILGHVHTPSQIKGIIHVGSAQIEKPEYQNGMNKSAQALCILHSNGKRQLLVNL